MARTPWHGRSRRPTHRAPSNKPSRVIVARDRGIEASFACGQQPLRRGPGADSRARVAPEFAETKNLETSVLRERRKHPRRDVNYPCWFSVDSKTSLIKGRIRDVSQGGARVACATRPPVPAIVDLYMTESGKVGRRCKVVWNSQDEFGLMFLEAAAPSRQDTMASPHQNDVVAI